MKETKMKGIVSKNDGYAIEIEFGSTQADFVMSAKGSHARKLKLKEGDTVTLTLRI